VRKRQVGIMVLCEDARHRQFVTAYLVEKGYQLGKLRVQTAPPGRGSGEQYVRENYAQSVSAFRRYCLVHQSGTCAFLAMIDADTRTVRSRMSDLDAELRAAGQQPRGPDEAVCVLVPKRHIETWAYHLLDCSRRVDERRDYKREVSDKGQLVQAGRNLVAFSPSDTCPPSLRVGQTELARLPR